MWNSVTDELFTTHCNYKWHCVDHLQYEGYLENLLPNVPLERKSVEKWWNETVTMPFVLYCNSTFKA